MSNKITIIDYGMGNLYSVCNAIAAVGGEPIVTSDKDVISAAEKIILPGVGAFGDCMANLHKSGLIPVIMDALRSGYTSQPDDGSCFVIIPIFLFLCMLERCFSSAFFASAPASSFSSGSCWGSWVFLSSLIGIISLDYQFVVQTLRRRLAAAQTLGELRGEKAQLGGHGGVIHPCGAYYADQALVLSPAS